MGIKGIYQELGPGQRVSLAKLAADCLERNGRPLRLAIDAAIWQFQAQAAKGGNNPAIRTLFYRLTRLLAIPIQPIFVFDGPNKPAFKRNKRSGRGDGVASAQAKKLIRHFGCTAHDAPGEAEAECALLQRHGIVDAVLSEDVDTIMFGCKKTLRNWSAESKTSKRSTHVSVLDSDAMNFAELGLDREGMVLVALMSGGDYLPDGIPGCGVKVACEAAKAGFGKSICRLKASDKAGIDNWRRSLIHELATNESGHFRVRHKALTIPENFPNLEVLRYYTHPVVSRQSALETLWQHQRQRTSIQLEALREFTRGTFGWEYRIGAIKFIRSIAPAVLTDELLQEGETSLVKRISGRRAHFSTDASAELRLSYIPSEVVPIDLSLELEETISSSRDGLALNSDDEFASEGEEVESRTPGKIPDPDKVELVWVLEGIAKKSCPTLFQDWEEGEKAKALRKSSAKKNKSTSSKASKGSGMPDGAMDKFVKTTKPASSAASSVKPARKPLRLPNTSPPSHAPSRQPRTIQQQSSKQSRGGQTDETGPNSQGLPRIPKTPRRPETIVISSSPSEAVSSSPPSPSPYLRSPVRAAREVRDPIPSAFSPDTDRTRMNRTNQRTERRFDSSPNPPRAAKFKQTSMNMFTKTTKVHIDSRPRPTKNYSPCRSTTQESSKTDTTHTIHRCTASTPPPRRVAPLSPSKRGKEPSRASRSPSPSPIKKKLLVPRTSAVGFFKEIEVSPDQVEATMARETKLLKEKGIQASIIRLSDVDFIDLSQDG